MKFLTNIELIEARSLAKQNLTHWQKRRIVQLYLNLHSEEQFKILPEHQEDERFEKLVNLSVGYFKDN